MNIAIYCGSNFGNKKKFEDSAKEVIKYLSKMNTTIVYGGSKSGLMGVISNEALKRNMKVYGVITENLRNKEIENCSITKLYKVKNIRQRKEKMEELSDAFIALPGGFGTLEEISEAFTSILIGAHKKPCALYNLDGYYDDLINFLKNCVNNGFLDAEHLEAIIVSDDIESIYKKFENYNPPKSKWELKPL